MKIARVLLVLLLSAGLGYVVGRLHYEDLRWAKPRGEPNFQQLCKKMMRRVGCYEDCFDSDAKHATDSAT